MPAPPPPPQAPGTFLWTLLVAVSWARGSAGGWGAWARANHQEAGSGLRARAASLASCTPGPPRGRGLAEALGAACFPEENTQVARLVGVWSGAPLSAPTLLPVARDLIPIQHLDALARGGCAEKGVPGRQHLPVQRP